MKKAILIVKKTYDFHRKTRIRQGYVVTYVFFDPIGKSKFLGVEKRKMLENMYIHFTVNDGVRLVLTVGLIYYGGKWFFLQ